jgi:hypothetical protein
VLQRQLSVGVATHVGGRAVVAGIVLAVFAACTVVSPGAFIVALNHAWGA